MLAGFQSQPSETRTAEAKERLTSKPQGVELVGDTPGLKYDESSPRCYKVLQMESRVCKHGKCAEDSFHLLKSKAEMVLNSGTNLCMANFAGSCSPCCGWCMPHWFSDQTRCLAAPRIWHDFRPKKVPFIPKWDDFRPKKVPFPLFVIGSTIHWTPYEAVGVHCSGPSCALSGWGNGPQRRRGYNWSTDPFAIQHIWRLVLLFPERSR